MYHSYCDILVVGAGPAGSSAARAAAGAGADVVMVEQRPVVGVPVQCAEYIPAQLMGEIDLMDDFSVQKIKTMKTIFRGKVLRETNAPGYVIRRDRFDQALADEAVWAGATIRLSTRAKDRTDAAVVVENRQGVREAITAKVVIGADGPHSRVARWMGRQKQNLMPAIHTQARLKYPMNATEVHFDPLFTGGYGWLFPKGDMANIGLGLKRKHGRQLKKLLDDFIDRLVMEGKIESGNARYSIGHIPAGPPGKLVKGNLLLVGDAAGHTHSITGAGIPQAVICGEMAGRWAAKAARSDDLSALDGYERQWRDTFERSLSRAYTRRLFLERNWHRLDEILKSCWVVFRDYYAPLD